MPRYLYVYHSGSEMQDADEDQGGATQAWIAWFGKLGAAVIDGGNPVGPSKTVMPGGTVVAGEPNPVGGYSIIEASDMKDAVGKAKGCPHLAAGGTVEIAEILPVM